MITFKPSIDYSHKTPRVKFQQSHPENTLTPHGDTLELLNLYNPTIEHIRTGQMIRVWENRGAKTWGQLVERVDVEHNRVLVTDNVGGTLQYSKWTPVNMIQTVWPVRLPVEVLMDLVGMPREIDWRPTETMPEDYYAV